MFPALASRSPAATASAASRSRSGRSRLLWSWWTTARSVVMGASVKFVINLYYHEFNSPLKMTMSGCWHTWLETWDCGVSADEIEADA